MPPVLVPRAVHPIRALLFEQRISYRQFGEAIGYSDRHVEKCVNGRVPPSAEFKRRASERLGLPEEQLFGEVVTEW